MLLFLPAVVALLLTLAMTPVCREACRRFGVVDHPDTRKLHRVPIPRAGGIAILLGYAAATCLPLGIPHHAWTILPAVMAAFGTGLLDDLVNLKPRTKLAGQVLAALLVCGAGIQIRGVGAWHIPLTVIWLVGCANAVNLIDGLDGLAAGVALFAAAAALLNAMVTGDMMLAVAAAALLGALLGFLPYNFHPASIFMGDCGSNTIGFLLGCFTILWARSSVTLPGLAAPVIALAIPILDTAMAIVRRFLRGHSVFAADRGHIHHRLLARGFSPRNVACIFYGGGGFLACLSILLTTGTYSSGPVLVAFGIVVWLALRYLGYDELASARRVFFGGAVRRVLTADLSICQLEQAVIRARSLEECWFAVESSGRSLGLARATMQVYGRTFAAQFSDSASPADCWSVRIPMEGAGAIDLEVSFGPAPAIVAPLANCLRRVLAPKLEGLRPPRAFAASAGAGTSFRRW